MPHVVKAGRLVKAMADANVTLTSAESMNQILEFTGALTALRDATVERGPQRAVEAIGIVHHEIVEKEDRLRALTAQGQQGVFERVELIALDLDQAHATVGKGGSAGGSSSTSYTYTAGVIMALGEGTLTVGQVWKGKNQFANSNHHY
jgi:hypothetical protein